MSDLNETPRANRISIAFFGLRNAGKSTLVNALTNQPLAIVSDLPGTTTDPVSKAMEILPLGPCLVTDTAGLDDEGEVGRLRVEKSLKVLATADVAVWVHACARSCPTPDPVDGRVLAAAKAHGTILLEHFRDETAETLKERIAALRLSGPEPTLLEGIDLTARHLVCVCPIDESAPKGRLILPQVQVIRDALDRHLPVSVVQPSELEGLLNGLAGASLVVTDSQAFAEVSRVVDRFPKAELTSFSILFARQKGDLNAFLAGVDAARSLTGNVRVLVAEGCAHHRQCNDIGTVKIPKALKKIAPQATFDFVFSSSSDFPLDDSFALVVQCGGCMLSAREMRRRIGLCRERRVPIVNYGLLLAQAAGTLEKSLLPLSESAER